MPYAKFDIKQKQIFYEFQKSLVFFIGNMILVVSALFIVQLRFELLNNTVNVLIRAHYTHKVECY